MIFFIEKITFCFALLVLFSCALVAVSNIPEGSGAISAAFFPRAILWLGAFLTLIALIQDVIQHKRHKVRSGDQIPSNNRYRSIICLLLVAAELVAYIAVFDSISFILSTSIFLFIGIMTCGLMLNGVNNNRAMSRYKATGSALIVAVGIACASYALFTQIFNLALP